ncbi:3-deoxy-D-manno-octulosonic acid transferase [Cognatishimia sp. SS12]|uniref:3-deoxy-D-manno-octulosonic acid transferase n=1 Tax=Cognatishimia sp. SS12 TaxID=2979465 RepID=UPI0023302A32|nr:3-deoxy-D-manno-octulosonic acid transferase [Cognatishimia sp. SS12]MDC0738712.1 3-deoxy-D-manno-octulosonic acid transferase [Cognatishimia sp. SS12]
MSLPPVLVAYLGFSRIADPVYRALHRRRLKSGKEDPARLGERYAQSPPARPPGRLVWFHAASVGESRSILELIRQLLAQSDDLQVLVTTNTRTSAQMLAQELPSRALHQYAPIDTTAAARAFLSHWQPDVAIWVESELWPRMLRECRAQQVPMMLLSARISTKTARLWRRWPRTLSAMLQDFDQILTQTEDTAQLIRDILGPDAPVAVIGALKQEVPPPEVNAALLRALQDAIGARPTWAAASTHEGEEDVLTKAHALLQTALPDALMILVPRHPERGPALAAALRAEGRTVALRSDDDALSPEIEIYIADTLGELGLWYRLAPVSFVAGSLLPIGGHNPFEPALLNSAILHGPHVYNFKDVYRTLGAANGCQMRDTPEHIAAALSALLTGEAPAMAARAKAALAQGSNATAKSLSAILRMLKPSSPP